MSGFSRSDPSAFSGLRLSQVVALLDVLRGMSLTSVGNVERRYEERATEFAATLRFLITIRAVRQREDRLSVARDLREPRSKDELDLPSKLAMMILARSSPYRSELFDYLKHFQVRGGIPEHRPHMERRSAESAIRNFMMDVGVVCYDRLQRRYTLSHFGMALFATALTDTEVVSQRQIRRIQQQRDRLGASAETAVLAFERERVGPSHAHQIDHVAVRNVSAGYDIRSVTLSADGHIFPRCIEVKAVPADTYRFYWTANEQEAARVFGSWYYLYLVPVDPTGTPSIRAMRMLPDPWHSVVGNTDEWNVAQDILECCLRLDGAASTGKENDCDEHH